MDFMLVHAVQDYGNFPPKSEPRVSAFFVPGSRRKCGHCRKRFSMRPLDILQLFFK